MTGPPIGTRFPLILCAVILAVGVAGCGKKSSPRPPKGEESAYTYPRAYPNPAGVRSIESEDEAEALDDPTAPDRESIIFFPRSRTTTIYDSTAPQ